MPQYIEHEFELDDFLGYFATLWIEVECQPGEEAVMYLRNGDPGHPGSPPTLDVIDARVTSLSGPDWDQTRLDILRNGWAPWLDKKALEAACDTIDGSLADDIFDLLEAANEQW